MLNTTLSLLACPRLKKANRPCGQALELRSAAKSSTAAVYEVTSGSLICSDCKSVFPILAGVAIVVDDVRLYLLSHVKGISKLVPDSEIPKEYRAEYLEAKSEIEIEHIEEDLESDRVTALYLMNHYLRVSAGDPFWAPSQGEKSALIDSLVREYWDHGPFHQIQKWVSELGKEQSAVELGCGVGGLCRELQKNLKSYLGIDSSFLSIALARHFNLGVAYPGKIEIPEDLLQGTLSRKVKIEVASTFDGSVDFVLGDLENLPVKNEQWDLSLVLNAIDMLEEPADLPKLQFRLLKKGGVAIQSCPYVWHAMIAQKLRKFLPKTILDSANAVEWLYEKAGFKIEKKLAHLPWLFFKHVRQIEVYSVHLLWGRK